MQFCLSIITWQAVAAFVTFVAVCVALVPIFREARRRKAQARSLRIRLLSKFTILKPALIKTAQHGNITHTTTVLGKDDFNRTVQSIETMMGESYVLEKDEQNQLGLLLANLELVAPIYQTASLTADIAKNVLALIDEALSVMEKNGLLSGSVQKPW